MRAEALTYVALLTLGHLQSAVASPTPALAVRHDHHHEHATPLESAATAVASAILAVTSSSSPQAPPDPHAGHGHGHGHGGHHKAQVELNETDVHYWHHFPPSYLAADFRLEKDQVIFGEELDDTWIAEEAGGHKGLAFVHAGTFVLAYFGFLPIALALRAAGHPAHHLVNFAFLAIATISWLAILAYRAATPDRYSGSSHAFLSNVLYFLSVGLTVFDSLAVVKRAVAYYRHAEDKDKSLSAIIRHVLDTDTGKQAQYGGNGSRYEMVGLTESDGIVFTLGDEEDEEQRPTTRMRPHEHSLILQQYPSRTAPSRSSTGSDGTLHDEAHHHIKHTQRMGAYDDDREHAVDDEEAEHDELAWQQPKQDKMTIKRFGEICLTWLRRTQVVIAYVTVLSGFVVYTGMCRASFLPSCLAHYIKGSIFFGYGVLTFARYLGAYADLGWAWNRRPGGTSGPTAEMVECAVIFTYGITQTWMERIGSHAGDPYTVKQVQHISIAVMFWFAGLGGMLLESKRMRRVMSNIAGRRRSEMVEPASYAFSFNPLPALVIAVTGLAMAAHHQNYVFQVEIHSLWGILLAGGSLCRMLTYFFLFLRPPVESELPSRPPTEILTSFGWAAGGIVFMLSNEETTFAAMRTGYDDMMAFLNFTIALTSAIFCWEVVVVGVKGWAVGRVNKRALTRTGRV